MGASPTSPVRARVGVSLLFFTNGALYSALLPRYPEIKRSFGLDDAQFGLVVVAFPLGSILAGAVAAPLIRRFGARHVAAVGSVLLAVLMWLAVSSPTVAPFVLAMLAGGVMDAVVDAAQNVQGIAVERWSGRSVINSFHAVWSIGAATGGVIGASAAAAGVGVGAQMLVNGVVWAIVAVLGASLAAVPAGVRTDTAQHGSLRFGSRAWRLLLPLVVLAIAGAMVEDVANNWVVLYLGRDVGAPVGVAGLGVSVVLGFQFVGRLLGDPLTDRFGREQIATAGGLGMTLGFLLVVWAPGAAVVFVGLALAGLGCATLVPAAFAAADRIPGLAEGTGVAMLGWLMRIGFLVTSPVVGGLAQATSLRSALVVPLLGGVVAVVMARLAARTSRGGAEGR